MKKRFLFKVLMVVILGGALTIPQYGCKSKDKEIVVAKNMKEDLNSTKSEILKLIEEGNTFLESGKFPEARASYEKAISKDKANENIYLEIKDTYMKSKRFDDAYYIIKLAIDNNVSKDSMVKILEEIKSNFTIIQLEDTINQGDDYSLPNPKTIPLDEISSPVTIQWTQKSVDTSNPGEFTFDGSIDEYGRKVQLKLTIKEVVKQAKEDEKTSNEGKKKSNEVATPQKKIEENANNEAITYKSQGLGLAFDMPGSWANNYVIKDDGTRIKVSLKHEDNNSGAAWLFTITSDTSGGQFLDSIYVDGESIRSRIINGKEYLVGGPTDIGLSENDPRFNEYKTMQKDIGSIIKSLRAA